MMPLINQERLSLRSKATILNKVYCQCCIIDRVVCQKSYLIPSLNVVNHFFYIAELIMHPVSLSLLHSLAIRMGAIFLVVNCAHLLK